MTTERKVKCMFYQNKHWLSLDDVDIISEDWAFYNMWYAKRMLERQAGLCKLSCFGFVNGVAHYEVYHWAKNHYEHHQELKEIVYKSEIEEQIKERLRDVDKTCKTVVSWGRQYYYEVYKWTKNHHIQQIARYHRYNTEMIEFQMAVINEREHEKEYLCSFRMENFFGIDRKDDRMLYEVKEWGQKHVKALEMDYLYLVLSEAPWFYYTSLPLPSGPSDKIGDV